MLLLLDHHAEHNRATSHLQMQYNTTATFMANLYTVPLTVDIKYIKHFHVTYKKKHFSTTTFLNIIIQ